MNIQVSIYSCSLVTLLLLLAIRPCVGGAIPDPGLSEAEPWDELDGPVMCPNFQGVNDEYLIGAATVHVTLRDINGQRMSDIPVILHFTQDDQEPEEIPLFCLSWEELSQGTTDLFGEVELFAAASGCMDLMSGRHQQIWAFFEGDWHLVRWWLRSKSPDSVTRKDLLQGVDLVDFVAFAGEFGGDHPSDCNDYNNNGTTGLPDFIIFSDPFVRFLRCTTP